MGSGILLKFRSLEKPCKFRYKGRRKKIPIFSPSKTWMMPEGCPLLRKPQNCLEKGNHLENSDFSRVSFTPFLPMFPPPLNEHEHKKTCHQTVIYFLPKSFPLSNKIFPFINIFGVWIGRDKKERTD